MLIHAFANLVSETVGVREFPPWSLKEWTPQVQDLYTRYVEFQLRCDHVGWRLSQYDGYTRFRRNLLNPAASVKAELPSISFHRTIVFSDSIFLASTALEPVLDAAVELMVWLLIAGIPARGAIAQGHFHTFEWNLRAGQTESFRASAPFLGSGVIRAYRAESKGPRGIRLIIHESCRNDLCLLDSWASVDLAPDEKGAEWQTEANLNICTLPPVRWENYLLRKLGELRDKAPESVKARYYDPTARMDAVIIQDQKERVCSRIADWRNDD